MNNKMNHSVVALK